MWLLKYIFTVVILTTSTQAIEFSDVAEIVKFGSDLVIDVLRVWKLVEPEAAEPRPGESETADVPFMNKNRKILRAIIVVNQKLDGIQDSVEANAQAIESLKHIPRNVHLQTRLDELYDLISQVSSIDDTLSQYVKYGYSNSSNEAGDPAWSLNNHTLLDFATNAVGHSPQHLRHILHDINNQIMGIHKSSVFLLLNEDLQTDGSYLACRISQSPQQFLMHLFNELQIVQLKGYAVMQFSWMLLAYFSRGTFHEEAKIASRNFAINQERQVKFFRRILRSVRREYQNCDPDNHEEGVTYDQLTRLLQGFLVNEVDMNSDQSCSENCGFYTRGKTQGCYDNLYCSQQPTCNGQLYDCKFFEPDMWVCPAKNSTVRRYDAIEYTSGRSIGKRRRGCKPTEVKSWYRVWYHCSYCMCLCDDSRDGFSDRYFSLREVLSDIQERKVVTGVRLVKRKGIIHIQIEQAKLELNGRIDQSSAEWKPVDEFSIYDRDVDRFGDLDFHRLTYSDRRLDLDDVVGAPGYILTGLAFRTVAGILTLSVRLNQINLSTGELNVDNLVWLDGAADNDKDAKIEIPLENLDIPTLSPQSSVTQRYSKAFIKFTSTSMESDVAQTTIPFIDIQEVVPNPRILLSGVGLYYKGSKGYGGFVAPRVFTYNFSEEVTPIAVNESMIASNEV